MIVDRLEGQAGRRFSCRSALRVDFKGVIDLIENKALRLSPTMLGQNTETYRDSGRHG